MDYRFFITFLIAFATSIGFMSTDIFLPSMPGMADDFGVHEDIVQISVGTSFLGAGISGLFSGILSDHYGRRPLMLWGILFFTFSSIICTITPSIYLLIAVRFFQGVGIGCMMVVGLATIHDMFSEKESVRFLSLMAMIYTIAPAVAPVIGGHIHLAFGWRMNFLFISLLAAVLALFLIWYFKETNPRKKGEKLSFKTALEQYSVIAFNKAFIAYSILMPLLFCGEMCYITTLPFYFIDVLNVPVDHFGYYMLLIVGAYACGATLTSRLVKTFSLNLLMVMGLSLCLIASVLQLFVHFFLPGATLVISLIFAAHQFGMAIGFAPSVTKSLSIFPHLRGAAAAVRNTFIMIAASLGAFVAGGFDETTLLQTAIFVVIMSVTPFLVLLWVMGIPTRNYPA